MKNLLETKQKNSIKSGDIFRLGNHVLACGDSTDKTLIKKIMEQEKIKLICCDPPYGVAYVESKKGLTQGIDHKIIANDHTQSEKEYTKFTQDWLSAIIPFLERKNGAYIFNSDKMIFSLREGMLASGYHFAQMLIWVKTQAVVGRMDYLPQHELVAYGWHGVHEFKKSKDKSILVYPKPSKSTLHPTMKPVGLIRRLILNSTDVGDSVYDPFGGSGSTLMACEQTHRKCFMVELDPHYCQVIISRWEHLTNSNAQQL